jgi:DNA-binding CsgD family transcriptional regulator
MSLPRPSGRRSLAVLVCPLGGATSGDALGRPEVVVFVTDPERRPQLPADILAKLYGLTPAETRLALLLAGGKRLEEAAEELGISTTTARWTLKNLFRKTETDRQADLVRLLLSSPVSVDPQPR